MARRLALAAFCLLASCDSSKECDGPSLALELDFFGPEKVESLLVTYEGEGISEREIHDVSGAPNLEIETVSAPAGEEVVISVRAYDGENIRGRLVAEGALGPLAIDRCERLKLVLADELLVAPDAGPKDAGARDAGDGDPEDAGTPEAGAADAAADGGEPIDAGEPLCPSTPDNGTLALFPFDGAEATTGMVTDVVSGRTGTAQPAQGGVASTTGPNACGDAAAFFGLGYLEIPSEGLAPAIGSVDFYVRFDGANPTVRQGIVSRDASGQTLSGHLSFFRTCDNHLLVRIQDTIESVHRCSDAPLPAGEWVHVALDFGEPGLALVVDGAVAASAGTRIANADCTQAIACDEPGVFGPSGNQNPWVLGADSSGSEEGLAEPVRNHFTGAIDQFRVSGIRRAP